jgi:hypothetical protein
MNKNKTMPYKIGAGEIDRLKMRCSAAVSIESNRTKDGAKIWRWGVTMAAVAMVMLLVIVNMDALFAPSYYEQYVEQLSDAPMEVLYDCVIDYVEYADDTTIL